ncbi:MAG: outer membrane lipoprotein carrier protein LolA [Acidobacteria bacterium]|jgi:outer membrane lipoprotein carrier protein|nr:outer membrane lipoprotein carrier protein LolA [Acidobacteriota bacterium]
MTRRRRSTRWLFLPLLLGLAAAGGAAAASPPAASPPAPKSPAASSDAALTALLRQAEARYRSSGSFRVTFRQTFESSAFGAGDEARGTIHVAPPRRVLWDYAEPKGQKGVLDGNTWWFAVPEDREVQVREVQPGEDNPLSDLLAGRSDLQRLFFVAAVAEGAASVAPGRGLIELRPQQLRDDIEWLRLEIDRATGDVRRAEVADPLGGRMLLELGAPVREAPLPDAAFRIEVPPGWTLAR